MTYYMNNDARRMYDDVTNDDHCVEGMFLEALLAVFI
jgi:hypothetical protein